jgi:hypothetical protein
MTTELTIASTWWKYWPIVVAGFFGPLAGSFLTRWFPFHFAMGISTFIAWTFVGAMFAKTWPPRWGLPRWLAAVLTGAASGLGVGLLTFFFPWKYV